MNKLKLILTILNTLAIAAVLGLFVYTRMIFKRPPITESQEREKIEKSAEAEVDPNAKKPILVLDPITVNLDPFQGEDGKQKFHFATMTVAVEIRSEKDRERFTDAKPVVLDRVIQNLGKKKFEDLNQVQGRYVFRSQIIDSANEYLQAPIVTEIFFNDFLLQ